MTARTLCVAFTSDWLFPTAQNREIVLAMLRVGKPASYAELAHLDLGMLLLTFVLAIVASVLAGLLPAWRAMQVTPAIQLKSQ